LRLFTNKWGLYTHIKELIARGILHDDEELVGGLEDLLELDDVRVPQLPHDVHLSAQSHGVELIAKTQGAKVDQLQKRIK
jgi:hypothetical protein